MIASVYKDERKYSNTQSVMQALSPRYWRSFDWFLDRLSNLDSEPKAKKKQAKPSVKSEPQRYPSNRRRNWKPEVDYNALRAVCQHWIDRIVEPEITKVGPAIKPDPSGTISPRPIAPKETPRERKQRECHEYLAQQAMYKQLQEYRDQRLRERNKLSRVTIRREAPRCYIRNLDDMTNLAMNRYRIELSDWPDSILERLKGKVPEEVITAVLRRLLREQQRLILERMKDHV